MAIDLKKIPRTVLVDLRDKLSASDAEQELPAGECSKDAEIAEMSAESMFDAWCDYEGLIGYGPTLRRYWATIYDAETK